MISSPLRIYRLPMGVASWAVFAISFVIYLITADPGVSYWDCPEYVTVASLMEIGHPPGNPVWMLAMRVATIPFPPSAHAYVINLCSGLCMAFAAFFLCRVIFLPILFSFQNFFKSHDIKTSARPHAVMTSIGASLCFSLCDSAWFSAVEAEVYAMSAMLMGASLWIMVKWWYAETGGERMRLMILISYLIGLSLGVHQLNLLCIPVFAIIVLYRRNSDRRINPLTVIAWLIGSLCIVGGILLVFMPGMLWGASVFELFFVNDSGLPFNWGVLVFIFMVGAIMAGIIWWAQKHSKPITATSVWMAFFLLIGYSSFGLIMIRGAANPFMNEGAPSDIFALRSYIEREQYPSTPLVYGQTPYSNPLLMEKFIEGKPVYNRFILEKKGPVYIKSRPDARISPRSGFMTEEDSLQNERILSGNKEGYLLADYIFSQKLTPELNMWFPRITSRDIYDRRAYADWAGMDESTMHRVEVSETVDSLGVYQPRLNANGDREKVYSYKPTAGQNLRFFLNYQVFYMYLRYLLWNFMGRQNDYPSTGEIDHGNFITGIDFIDNSMLGDTDFHPDELWKGNPGHNNYYSIPFILGVAGIIWLLVCSRISRRILSVTGVFFIMTGIAIVVYLNQTPGEPRERDYTFLGSYMAFAMWIGAGLTLLCLWAKRYLPARLGTVCAAIICFSPATLMGVVNFDDHDRRGRSETSFYASSILDFELPAIIFSQGDNATFPNWYASEVLGMGEPHIPLDVTYLGVPSYIVNLQQQHEKKLPTVARGGELEYGAFLLTRLPADSDAGAVYLPDALRLLYANRSQPAVWSASKVLIPSNKGDMEEINLRDFTNGSAYLSFRHLMLLDILAAQLESSDPKSLYFPYQIERRFYRPLEPLMSDVLFGKIYNPRVSDSIADAVIKESIHRELDKLETANPESHYIDPVIADRSRRYRGELIIAADGLLQKGDTATSRNIIEAIETYYPYSSLSPGSFTIGDSTFYEGKEYLRLLNNMKEETGNECYEKLSTRHSRLLEDRKKEWYRYYNDLTPAQRKALSPRSRRELL